MVMFRVAHKWLAACVVGAVIACVGLIMTSLAAPVKVARVASVSDPQWLAWDQSTRSELAVVVQQVTYHVFLPSYLPAGVTYWRLDFDAKHPEYGIGILFAGPDPNIQTLQINEAPLTSDTAASARNPINRLAPSLRMKSLGNGSWRYMQKPDAPLRGAWLYFTTMNGVQLNIQSQLPNAADVDAIAASMK